MISSTDSSLRCSIETSGAGQRPRDVEQQAARDDDLALAVDVGLERRAQRELHVGRGELELAVLDAQPDAAEHEHGRPRRDRAGDERELLGETPPAETRSFNMSASITSESIIL